MKQLNFLRDRETTGLRVLWMSFNLVVAMGLQGWGQTNTWQGTSNGFWNTATNWSLNEIPTSAHDVVIPNNFTVTVNTDAVCNTFTINGGANKNSVTITDDYSLTVSGAVSIGGGTTKDNDKYLIVKNGTLSCASISIASTGHVNAESEVQIFTGTVNVTGDIIMNGGSGDNYIKFSGIGTLNLGGSISGGNLVAFLGCTVNFNGINAAQMIPNNTYVFHNITINNTHPGGATFDAPVTVANIINSITVGNATRGSILNTNNFAVTRGNSDAITVEEGSILNAGTSVISWVGGNGLMMIDGTFKTANPSGFSGATGTAISSKYSPMITLGNNSIIEYNASGTQTVSARNYRNFSTSGTGIKIISGTVTAEGIITIDGALTVAPGVSLSNNGSMIINSTSITSGSFINNGALSGSGTVTYNRWLNHANTNANEPILPGYSRWYITSAPVKVYSEFNANAGKIHQDANANDIYDFATYSESGNDWDYLAAIPSPLDAGKGYLISLNPSSDGIIQFTGALNNGNITPSVTSSPSNGWNAVGNPYTSAIWVKNSLTTAEDFLTKNASQLSDNYAAIYVWNETGAYDESQQYYKVIGNSGYTPPWLPGGTIDEDYIQAGQGFLINAKSSSFVTFTKAMQDHQSTIALKSAAVSWPGMTLLAESHGQTRSTVVAYNDQMTTGLDVTYDAGLLAADVFQVYTHLVEGGNPVDFAIQCLPDNHYRDLIVPVGVDLPEGGELSFKASGIILPEGLCPVIEDNLLNIKIPLKAETDSYSVILDKNTSGTGRFYLSVEGIRVGTTEIPAERKFSASFLHNRFIVFGQVDPGTKALVYELTGRKVGEYPLKNLNYNEIRISGVSQRFYLLKIVGKNYFQVIKVVGE